MRIFKQWVCIAALAAFFVALPTGYAEPRDSWSLEARVPASTLALISIEDVGSLDARFEKTAIAGLFREPEMQAFCAPINKSLEDMLASEDASPFGEATPMVMKMIEQLQGLRGQLAVAILEADFDADMPKAAASFDFGPNIGDFAKFLDGLRKEIDPEGNAITRYEKDGRTWWQLQDGPPIAATTVDTAFVLATDPTLLESVIAGGQGATLAKSEDFQNVRARAGGDSLGIFAYANVPAILDEVGGKMDAETVTIANALGLDTVKAVAYGMAFSGDGFMDSIIIHTPGADHGIVPLFNMPAYQPRALSRVPANAFYYEEGSVNIGDLVPNIRKLLGNIDAGAMADMEDGLRHLNGMLGVDLEKEILGGLAGGACTYLSMPDTGGLFPEVAFMMQVKDPATFEAAFDRLANGIAGAVTEEGDVIASTRKLSYRKHVLHLFEMQAARGDDVVPFTPTWTILDDWLVLTLVPHAMKEIVLRSEATVTGGGLAAQEDFRALRRVMPEGAGELTYIDLQAVLNLVYDTAVPVLQTAVKPNVLGREIPFTLDWAQLPAARTVRPYFRSMALFTTWNQDGIAIQMHGPLPLTGVLMVGMAVAVPMFMGTMQRGPMPPGIIRRPRPKRAPMASGRTVRALDQARQISSYVRVFILTKKRMPRTLQELVRENVAGSLPKDPWGGDYKLEILDEKTRKFRVVSGGPDGQHGTGDDISAGP